MILIIFRATYIRADIHYPNFNIYLASKQIVIFITDMFLYELKCVKKRTQVQIKISGEFLLAAITRGQTH